MSLWPAIALSLLMMGMAGAFIWWLYSQGGEP